MITVFAIFILIHGLIHLLGFAKAFHLAEVKELDMPVTPLFGILWLTAFLLHGTTAGLILLKFNIWWVTGLLAVVLSLFLIFNSWQYAKFGSLPNIIILIISILGWADHRFNKEVTYHAREMINKSVPRTEQIVTDSMLNHLPLLLQNYLRMAGVVGQPVIQNVRIRQQCRMKMTPEQTNWSTANALQYVSTDQSAFIWKVRMNMYPLVDITGRDMLLNGKGSMQIKILSLLPVVDANGEQIDEGSLQRYMCEAVWYPTAFLRPEFIWEAVDSLTISARYQLKDFGATATFFFEPNGRIKRMTALRYQGSGKEAIKREWVIDIEEYDTFNELLMPSKVSATWRGEGPDWRWLEMNIDQIEYNIGDI